MNETEVPEFIAKGVEVLNLFAESYLSFSFTPDILRRIKFGEDAKEEKLKVRRLFIFWSWNRLRVFLS
jgi:hypothetical protein